MIYDESAPSVQQFGLDLSRRQPITRAPAGFGESFMQELGEFWRENTSVSQPLALSGAQTDRARKIRELAGDQAFIKAITTPGDPRTQELISALAAEHDEIGTDEELRAAIKEQNAVLRGEKQAALESQTAGGKVGGFLGVMAGALSDPIVLGTLPIGAAWATGVLRTALIEAGIGAGIEAIIQPAIYRYKRDLESPYDLSDVLVTIAGAGIGAGAFTGGVKATVRAVSRFGRAAGDVAPKVRGLDDLVEAAQRLPNPTEEQKAAVELLQQQADALRQSPFTRAAPELDDIHLRALAKATDDVSEGRAVDVSEMIEQPAPERVRIVKEGPAPRIARESQTLGEYIRNSGGVSVEQAGALRGEFDALYEGGGRRSGTVKRKAGLSPDDLAQRAHEAGYIDEPDPYLLKEALERDLAGEKVYSGKSDRLERKLELEIDREFEEFERLLEIEFEEGQSGIAQGRKVGDMLAAEDVQIRMDDGTMRSAREVIGELDQDAKAAAAIKNCMVG